MFSYQEVLQKCREKPEGNEYRTISDYYDDLINTYGEDAEKHILSEMALYEKKKRVDSYKRLMEELDEKTQYLCDACPYEAQCEESNFSIGCKNSQMNYLTESFSNISAWLKKEKIYIPEEQIDSFAWYILQSTYSGRALSAEEDEFSLQATVLELFLKEQHVHLSLEFSEFEEDDYQEDRETETDGSSYIDMPRFLFDALWYFKTEGFPVTVQTAERLMHLSGIINVYDLTDIFSALKLILCKTSSDEKRFNVSFCKRFAKYYPDISARSLRNAANVKEDHIRIKADIAETERKIKQIKAEYEESDNTLTKISEELQNIIKQNSLEDLSTEYKKNEISANGIIEKLPENENVPFLSLMLQGRWNEARFDVEHISEAKSLIEDCLKLSLFEEDALELIGLFAHAKQILNKVNPEVLRLRERRSEEIRRRNLVENRRRQEEEKLEILKSQEEKKMVIVKKLSSINHRPEFIGGYRAVQSDAAGEIEKVEFSSLSTEDKKVLYDMIRANTEKIKKTMKKNMRSQNRKHLDLKETAKKACETGGVPIRLCYSGERKTSPNIVMILDVSGSCQNASEIMLVFMHYMKEVFRGGCKAFAFVREAYDITNAIKSDHAEDAVKNVFDMIPRRGVYSSYEAALKSIRKEYMTNINKDSIVLFMGDARNNKNESMEDVVRDISRKAKRCYWLNTESRELWNTGDSIIDIYAPYMDEVAEIVNAGQFLRFMEHVS